MLHRRNKLQKREGIRQCDTIARQNGTDLCVNQGDLSREWWASLADEERKKKEKILTWFRI